MNETILDAVKINFDSDSQRMLNMVLALVMFGVAIQISVQDFKATIKQPKSLVVGICAQFFLLPAVTFLLVWLLKPEPSIALGMFLVAACPGGNVSNFMAYLSKGNSALSVSLTAIATLFSIFMTPFNFQFWAAKYGPTETALSEILIAPSEMITLVLVLLGLPLLLGMMVNYWFPRFSTKLSKTFKVVSLLFFAVLIFLALYNNRDSFAQYISYVFWIVILHNLLGFASGFSLARLSGLSKRDVRTVTIETGIQNSGLGLIIIFTFFEGLGGMALVAAFWGIWHLASGLLLAGYWSKKSVEIKRRI